MSETQEPNGNAASSPIRVLVVDNDKSHAQAMAETLERVDYDCTVATSGPDGAQFIDQDAFDVVITDLVMNEVDGEEILRRAKEALPDCEVIVVTGHASVPKAVEAMQQGAFNFLEKPLTPDRLRAVTEKAADAVRQAGLPNIDELAKAVELGSLGRPGLEEGLRRLGLTGADLENLVDPDAGRRRPAEARLDLG